MRKYFAIILILVWSGISGAQSCEHDAAEHVRVDKVDLVGAESVDPNITAAIIGNLQKDISEECQLKLEFLERLRDGFQQAGYFKALPGDGISLQELQGTPTLKRFAVKVTVNPGEQYRLDHFAFTGGTVFSDTDLRATVPLVDGEIFNVEKMREALKNLRDKYGSQGYINFTPVPNTEIDDEKKRITITFDLDEGEQFRVGRLIFDGPEPCPGEYAKLVDAWAPYVGRVWNRELFQRWTETMQRLQGDCASKALLDHGQKVNPSTKTVDYSLQFKAAAGR